MGGREVPADDYVPVGERTDAEEQAISDYEEGYMSGVAYTEAEVTRLRAKLTEAEARLAAKERHPANNPAERLEISIHKTYDILDTIADEMKVMRQDIGAVASILYWMKKREERKGDE